MQEVLLSTLRATREAAAVVAQAPAAQRTEMLHAQAAGLRRDTADLLAANAEDVQRGRDRGLDDAFLDRLELTNARVEAMACAVEEIAAQPDPVGERGEELRRPNGLRVCKERIPLGVVCMIYEARPNVTSDAAALCIRSGNAVVLRGGSDARRSNEAIGRVVRSALGAAGLPEQAAAILASMPREDLPWLLQQKDLIDLVIPRGGTGLIETVSKLSRIPLILHYRGNCHVYLHDDAPLEEAVAIVRNAKVSRPSVCNAAETLLVHAGAAARLLPAIGADLVGHDVTLHACEESRRILSASDVPCVAATDEDWATEYLSLDLAIRVVPSLEEAVTHIRRWGSDHTEAIVTRNMQAMDAFVAGVSSSTVVVNASTRFADGGELGLGAEIGISTSRLHAYGPMGARELTTTRFVIRGDGQVRG